MLHRGDRVELTEEGRRNFPKCPLTGTVAAEPMKPNYVRIVRDGIPTPDMWHARFWRKVSDAATA